MAPKRRIFDEEDEEDVVIVWDWSRPWAFDPLHDSTKSVLCIQY
jgi:uncharacterized protein (DUF58 family)